MNKRYLHHALVLAAFFAAGATSAAELVTEFTGRGATTTTEFEVQAPWILDWRVNSDYQKSMKIEVHLVDSMTGFHRGRILRTLFPGNGVRMFNESGRFRLRISATLADWRFKVEELTPDEAELYTPRN